MTFLNQISNYYSIAIKKIGKIVYIYINIESTMNGFIKFEVKKLKTKKKQ